MVDPRPAVNQVFRDFPRCGDYADHQTTNEVARAATKDDLAPTLGDRRVWIYLQTPVPSVLPWAVISRINVSD